MFEIRVHDDELKALERSLRTLGGNMGTVMSRALNKTATTARTEISRTLASRTGLKVSAVKAYAPLRKATRSNLRATIDLRANAVSLTLLGPKKTGRGLSVKTGSGRVLIRRAFPALHGWFHRQDEGETRSFDVSVSYALGMSDAEVALVPRLPISRIRGPYLSAYWSSMHDEQDRLERKSQARLKQNIANQVQLILKRKGVA